MNEIVEVPFGEDPSKTAQGLLAAAERLDGFTQDDVKTTSFGAFRVPQEVADEASAYVDRDEDDAPAEKPLDKLTNADLEALAEAEGIELEPADKKNKGTRVAAIAAGREAAAAEKAAAEAEANVVGNDNQTSDSAPDPDDNEE